MRIEIVALAITALTLTACGQALTAPAVTPAQVGQTEPPQPSPLPAPSPTPVQTPSCKSLFSPWGTPTQPVDAFLGRYTGPPTNGPVYSIDLSALRYNNQLADVRYDSDHVCQYDVTVWADKIILNGLNGCTPWVLPGHPVNTQCDYCPDAYLTKTFPVEQSCNQIKITDPTTGDTYTYH